MILNQAETYCMQVFTSASVSMPLVVGLSVLKGRRRMLLGVGWDQPLLSNVSVWEGEGEPCRSLVLANASNLGILELYTRSECWRWRDVGVQIIADENMTDVSPFFLVSWRDLLSAMLAPGSMIEILAKAPVVVNRMLLHSEFAQPLYMAALYYSNLLPVEIWRNGSFLNQARSFFYNRTTQPGTDNNYVIMGLPAVLVLGRGNATGNYTTTAENGTNNATGPRRSLKEIPTTIEPEMVGLWSKGPYVWPPTYDYWKATDGKATCAVVNTAMGVFKNGLNITMMYYNQPRQEPLDISLPSLPMVPLSNWSLVFTLPDNMLDSAQWMWSVAKIAVNETQIKSFLETPSYGSWTESLIHCDFVKVQTCLDRRSLFWTAVNTLVVFAIATVCARVMGVPYVEVLVIMLYVPTVLYFAYGYNMPMCAPLVPTCLLEDVKNLLEYFFPENMQWPDELTTMANCSQVSCMRSCVSDANVGFSSIADHAAWALCEVDQSYCKQLGTTTSIQALKGPLTHKGSLYGISQSMRNSQRICFLVTMVHSFPMRLVLTIVTSFLPAAVGVVFSVAQYVVTMVITLLIFVHSSMVAE
jgi:hypothetical protein